MSGAQRSGSVVETSLNFDLGEPSPGSARASRPGSWVGTVIDAEHPVLRGRVRVRWDEAGSAVAAWVPTLASLAIRAGDRVLVTAPAGFDEPLVTGVIDGFTPRPEAPSREGAALALGPGEHLAITDAAGAAIVEIHSSPEGPRVKVLHAATTLDLPGKLSIRADAIELAARAGEVRVEARDDVRVNGAFIRLNGR